MSIKEKYGGVIVPMVSPFNDDFSIDKKAVESIIQSFLLNDVLPFVLGTTGEAPSLSSNQKVDLIKITFKVLNGKQPLLAGISGNSIFTVIEEGKKFAGLGVEALVATPPNYYPSDGAQMLKWFEHIADNVPVPLFLYNIPATTHHSIPLNFAEKLSTHPNIAGIKDSEQNEERLIQSLNLWKDRDDFSFLVGWAAKSAFGIKNGANGIVPSMGNLIPELYKQIVVEAEKGNSNSADELQELANTIAAYCQKGRNISQSIPALKVMMAEKGLCGTQVLPPMLRMNQNEELEFRKLIRRSFKDLNVIK
jgi:4-hydroxy-tetrahydrodipicolinate synthase